MLQTSRLLALTASLLTTAGACTLDDAEGRKGDLLDVGGAGESPDGPGQSPADTNGDIAPDAEAASLPPIPGRSGRATLVFDDGQTPFAADDPVFFEGGAPADFTGTPLTDWAIDTVDAGNDANEYLLVFEHTGLALVDIAAGDASMDLAVDVYDLDGNLLVSVDSEGPGGLEGLALEADEGSEPLVIAVHASGLADGSEGRYVVTLDAAD